MSVEVGILISLVFLAIMLFGILCLQFRQTKRQALPKTPQVEVTSPDLELARYQQLVLGDPEQPLATIQRYEPPAELPLADQTSQLDPLPLSRQQLGQLQNVFRYAPSLVKSAASLPSNTYVLKFPPEVAEGLRNGSLKMGESLKGGLLGVARDAQGKIVSHGTLIPASGLTVATVAASAFQILAIATAQYYLPQINRRLARIEQGIQDIQAHLASQDKATLTSSLKRLRSMGDMLAEGNFREEDLLAGIISLDAIDRDSDRILETYREHMQRYRSELDGLVLSGVFSPDFKPALEKASQYENAALVCLQAMYVKSAAAQFRCAMPPDSQMTQAHSNLQELGEELGSWAGERDSFVERLEERIRNDTTVTIDFDPLTEAFGSEYTLPEMRDERISEASQYRRSLTELHDELAQAIGKATENTARQLSRPIEPLSLVVTLNERNEIEEVCRAVV